MIEKINYQKGKFFKLDDSPKPEKEKGSVHVGKIRESSLDIGFSKSNRQNHTHISGSTGTGKSKLLEALIRQDILNKDCGLCLLDPHGSLYDEILLYASHKYPHLADRFILFNPAKDLDEIIGFNPIYENANTDYLLNILISSCLKAWGQDNTTDTPRITRWLGNIFYPIIRNELTLLETPVLLNTKSKKERGILLQRVNNIAVENDWAMFDDAPLREKLSYIEGAANRLNRFLSNGIIRHIIVQNSNKLNFKKIMDEGKILLINLNEGERISYENAQLLGIMLVNEIFRVAKTRDPRDTKLKPFYFYIDEFSQFVTKDIARSLDETRKFKLFMILAHQHLAQLKKEDEHLYGSVMTNCKNKIVFGGLSVEDAEIMNHELQTGFIDLKKIKDELYKTRVAHKEQTKVTITESESQGESENWSDSSNSSTTENRSNTSSTNESYSTKDQTSSTNQYHQQQVGRTGHSVNTGSSFSESRGTGESRSYGTSQTEGSSKTQGGGSSKTIGRSVAKSTGFFPYKEELELSSREFWSKDELLYMKMGELKNQDVAEAIIKVGSKAPIRCKVKEVRQVHYSERYSPEKISKFRESVIDKQDCYTPLTLARQEYQERQTKLFGEPLRFDDEDSFVAPEGMNDTEEKQSRESKFN